MQWIPTWLDLVGSAVQHSAFVGVVAVMACVLMMFIKRAHSIVAQAVIATFAFGAVASFVVSVLMWVDAGLQLGTVGRALQAWRSVSPAPGVTQVLVLNSPAALVLPANRAQQFGVADLGGNSTFGAGAKLAQMIDGNIGAPGTVNGFVADYDGELKLTRAEAEREILNPVGVILATMNGTRFGAQLVGYPVARAIDALAGFESGAGRVVLQSARACRDGDVQVTLVVRDVTGKPTTTKFFRHVINRADGSTTGLNDAILYGGLLDLSQFPADGARADVARISVSDPRADLVVQLGIYDWSTGKRWLALRQDGGQWPENTVTIPVATDCGS